MAVAQLEARYADGRGRASASRRGWRSTMAGAYRATHALKFAARFEALLNER